MTTTPLTSAEIREWAINRLTNYGFADVYDPYNECLKDLIFYIDNEPKLRETMGEEE